MSAADHGDARQTAMDPDVPSAPAPPDLQPGDRVQRYEIRHLLGAGGGGRVYAAYDPKLAREVALKVLGARGSLGARGTSGAQRLIREARAMASLSHPNVAEVHLVGEVRGGVFIAMELLPGGTLTEWIFDAPRSWEAVLDKFVAAGRGLSHAHAAGMVHRDFKPDNVLLTAEGVPRVLDFGLARREDRPTPSGDAPTPADTLEPISGQSSQLGTPAYMAPEQHLGTEVDARADQFAFAVALYEALYGRRPYQGRSLAELAVAVTSKAPEFPPTDRAVPRRIWRAIRRGLARDPDERWPTMAGFLDVLTEDRRPRRRWILGAVAVVGLGGVAMAVTPPGRYGPPPCEVGAARVDAIWSAARRDAVAHAFADTKIAVADRALRTVTERVETWASAWRQAYGDACTAAASAKVDNHAGDARMRCLSRQLDDVDALVAVLSKADGRLVQRAADVAARIPPASRCADASEGTDPRTAAALDKLHREVSEIRALALAGRADEALAKSEALYERTRDQPEREAQGQGLLQLGMALERTGQYDRALPLLTDANHLAVASDLPKIAVEAGVALTYLTGYRLSRPEEGLRWARTTHAAIERSGGNPDADARLLSNEAAIHERLGDYQAAYDDFDRARAMNEAFGAAHPAVPSTLINMGLMLHRLGRSAEARTHLERALALIEEHRGKDHPLAANALNNLGIVLEHQGELDAAAQRYRAALELGERNFGAEHPSLASALNNLANVAWRQERFGEAIAFVRRALAIREAAFGEDHPRTAFSVRALGTFVAQQGDLQEALRLHQRALQSYEAALGPDHPEVAACLEHLGRALTHADRTAEALAHHHRALEIRLATLGAAHRDVAMSHLRIGQAHARAGAVDEARVWFDRARPVLVRELPEGDPDRAAAVAGPEPNPI